MKGPPGLVGARVQRIDGPRADLFALTLHRADLHGCLVLSTVEGRAGIGWVSERPRGAPASSFVLLLRKHLENGRIVASRTSSSGAEIAVRRGEIRAVLRLELRPPNLLLVLDGRIAAARRTSGVAIGAPYDALTDGAELDPSRPESDGTRLVEGIAESRLQARIRETAVRIDRRVRQLERRMRAIEDDLSRVDDVLPLRARASLLLAHLTTIPDGAHEAIVTDWNADPPVPIRIPIDPARGAKGEAEALFRRARKLERGGTIALTRHAETEREIEKLRALRKALTDADEAGVDEIEGQAARLGAGNRHPTAKKGVSRRRPFRAFRGSGDRPILVGRSAADNDALTLGVARPHDHWLHARGVAGSHVVVPLDRGESCPPQLLVDAAHLAAHFSNARGEPIVDIQHVARRYVRKPRGVAPGSVTLSHEKVLVLRVEPERLARLLGSEDPG